MVFARQFGCFSAPLLHSWPVNIFHQYRPSVEYLHVFWQTVIHISQRALFWNFITSDFFLLDDYGPMLRSPCDN